MWRRVGRWAKEHRILLLFLLLMAVLLPARDLWAPDEPDFAQAVREMRERGSWLLPYLNGQPYDEKPILFYWAMKASVIAGEGFSGGRGFIHGIAPWALRLPSVLAAVLFALGFTRWVQRFQGEEGTDLSCMILFTTPLWIWQAQTIQVDMLFSALLAWSWLAWLGGYLLSRGEVAERRAGEGTRWFAAAYLGLGLAILTKGPLALVLSILLLAAFLAWQRDPRALLRMRLPLGLLLLALVVLPWYVAAALKGGGAYAYQLLVHQNFERATRAWDHVQPWWQYLEYLVGDFWPWCLLLPPLVVVLLRSRNRLPSATRFHILAFAVPFLFLSWVQSKQGKYLLMVYPFLALLLPVMFQPRVRQEARLDALRWARWALPLGLWIPALGLLAAAFGHAGGHKLQAQVAPFLPPLRAMAVVLAAGAGMATFRAWQGASRPLLRESALALGAMYLLVGAWAFPALNDIKGYHRWTAAAQPLMAGRKVYFWQTIRSGAMVYTDHHMPELRSAEELERVLGPEDRLVSQRREWDEDSWGMDAAVRQRYEVILRVPTGGGELLLIQKRPGS